MNDLKILISADDKASAVMRKVRGEVAGLSQASAAASNVLRSLGPLMAGAFSVAGIAAFARTTVNGIDKLNDLSDATGASVENLSALEDVAIRTGSSMEDASDAVVKLNKALNEAKPGSDTERAFKALGLSISDLKAQDPVLALRAVAGALSNFSDDANKARLVQELFGKSLRQIAPLLAEMATAQGWQAKVTTEQAKAAEALNKEFANLAKNSEDFARTLAGPLIKAANGFFEAIKRNKETGKGIVASMLDIETAARIVQKYEGTYSNEGRNYPKPSLPASLSADKIEKIAKLKPIKADTTPDFDPYLAALKELEGTDIEKIKRLNATLEQLLQLQAAGMSGQGTAQAIDSVRAALEKLDPVVSRAKEAAKAIDELLGIGPDSGFSKKLDQMEELGRRLEGGLISPDAYIAALKQLDGDFTKTADHLKETGKDVGEELGLVFSSAAGEAISKFGDLRSILKGVLADLEQIAVRETVTKPLTNWLQESLKGFSWASLLASAKGNAFGPGGVMPFAMGGIVTSPTLFKFASGAGLMGEAGPEAILPLQRGSDGKLGVAGGGKSVAITYAPTINIDSRSDRAQVGALVAQAVAQGNQQMIQHLKAQGAL